MPYNKSNPKDLNVFQLRQQPHSRIGLRLYVCYLSRDQRNRRWGDPHGLNHNVFGWTLINNDQNEIEIHNDLSERDYVTTLIHELVHVKQNVNGVTDDTIREGEAYELENTLADIYLTGNSYRMLKQC